MQSILSHNPNSDKRFALAKLTKADSVPKEFIHGYKAEIIHTLEKKNVSENK